MRSLLLDDLLLSHPVSSLLSLSLLPYFSPPLSSATIASLTPPSGTQLQKNKLDHIFPGESPPTQRQKDAHVRFRRGYQLCGGMSCFGEGVKSGETASYATRLSGSARVSSHARLSVWRRKDGKGYRVFTLDKSPSRIKILEAVTKFAPPNSCCSSYTYKQMKRQAVRQTSDKRTVHTSHTTNQSQTKQKRPRSEQRVSKTENRLTDTKKKKVYTL